MIINVEVAITGNSFSRSNIKPRNTLYFVTGNMSGNIYLTLPVNLNYTITEKLSIIFKSLKK